MDKLGESVDALYTELDAQCDKLHGWSWQLYLLVDKLGESVDARCDKLRGWSWQVRLLVDKLGESVDARDVYGRTPLMLACLIDDQQTGDAIVRLLLSRRADVSSHTHSLCLFAFL